MVGLFLQVLELTKEWTNKWNETQNILKVTLSVVFCPQTFERVCVWRSDSC